MGEKTSPRGAMWTGPRKKGALGREAAGAQSVQGGGAEPAQGADVRLVRTRGRWGGGGVALRAPSTFVCDVPPSNVCLLAVSPGTLSEDRPAAQRSPTAVAHNYEMN